MPHPTRRTTMLAAIASVAVPLAADLRGAVPPKSDYAAMAIELVATDFAAGWRYPVDRERLARIAGTLEALGVVA
jgi:hypothetical protein